MQKGGASWPGGAGGPGQWASYRGSREPAGQAGRREGRRRSYSPWWSQPCREAGTDTRGQAGETDRGQWGGRSARAHPACHPPPLSTRIPPTLPPSLFLRQPPHSVPQSLPTSPPASLPAAPTPRLATRPPCTSFAAASPGRLAPDLSSGSASLGLCLSIWPPQICLALNLAPTPWPAPRTPGLAHLAPK